MLNFRFISIGIHFNIYSHEHVFLNSDLISDKSEREVSAFSFRPKCKASRGLVFTRVLLASDRY